MRQPLGRPRPACFAGAMGRAIAIRRADARPIQRIAGQPASSASSMTTLPRRRPASCISIAWPPADALRVSQRPAARSGIGDVNRSWPARGLAANALGHRFLHAQPGRRRRASQALPRSIGLAFIRATAPATRKAACWRFWAFSMAADISKRVARCRLHSFARLRLAWRRPS